MRIDETPTNRKPIPQNKFTFLISQFFFKTCVLASEFRDIGWKWAKKKQQRLGYVRVDGYVNLGIIVVFFAMDPYWPNFPKNQTYNTSLQSFLHLNFVLQDWPQDRQNERIRRVGKRFFFGCRRTTTTLHASSVVGGCIYILKLWETKKKVFCWLNEKKVCCRLSGKV